LGTETAAVEPGSVRWSILRSVNAPCVAWLLYFSHAQRVGVGSSVLMDLGFHIADFTWNGGPPELAVTLGRLAREAEAGGIARLTVMDHFWQIGPVGAPEESMLEAYTTLGYLAAVTERVLLHTLVTGWSTASRVSWRWAMPFAPPIPCWAWLSD
jgi:hypothetical protein